jgi:Glyoxalase/Bleomycin resistance protein/Dioxygenase superfamily
MKMPSSVAPLQDLGPIDHFGIVAQDIIAAMELFGGLYGLSWTHDVVDAERSYESNGTLINVTLNVGRIKAPTAMEFVGAVRNTTWEPRPEPYLHHVAYKVDDFQSVCASLASEGGKLVLTLPNENHAPFKIAYYQIGEFVVELQDNDG